jgi:uncharacterized membrane protein YgcG
MKPRGAWLQVFFPVLLVLVALPLFAADPAAVHVRVARLSLAQGDVQIDRNVGQGWERAIANMPVNKGARIYVAENGRAELELEDGSSLRMAGPAQITVKDLSTTAQGVPVDVFQINSGVVYFDARLLHQDDLRIEDADGTAFAITKPSHLRFTVDQQTASVAVSQGEAVAEGGDARVSTGQTYNYVLGQTASAVRLNRVIPESEDGWNQQRESYDDQYASQGAQFSGSDEPQGAADLGYYGNYQELPDYGVAWQPNDVGSDWSPFDNGAWSYYPDWGWTFVSGYPWGWAPFYYGNWCYINGRGWWWVPGAHGPGWHPRPHVVGSAGANLAALHPPSKNAPHTTVAVAGSHLTVGAVGTAASEERGLTGRNQTMPRTTTAAAMRTAPGFKHGEPTGGPAGRIGVDSNLVRGAVVTGERGSYRLAQGVQSGRNGYELQRSAPLNRGLASNVSRPMDAPVHSYASPSVPQSTGSAPQSAGGTPHGVASHPSSGSAGGTHSVGGFSGGGHISAGGGGAAASGGHR